MNVGIGKTSHALATTPGAKTSWGDVDVTNPTSATMVVHGVDITSSTPGLVGSVTRMYPGHKGYLPGNVTGYPPPSAEDAMASVTPADMSPVQGAKIAPNQSFNLLIELVAPQKPGEYLAGPVYIDYSIGTDHYRAKVNDYGGVCTWAHNNIQRCNLPG